MLSHKASGNTHKTPMHAVNVKIAQTEQKHICGNANVAAELCIHPFILNGLKHTQLTTNKLVRCDRCIAVDQQQTKTRTSQNVCYGHAARYNQHKQLTTPDHPATIETTVTTVQVLCPICITPQAIDMSTTPDHPATIELTVATVHLLCPSCNMPKDIDMNM